MKPQAHHLNLKSRERASPMLTVEATPNKCIEQTGPEGMLNSTGCEAGSSCTSRWLGRESAGHHREG